VTKKINRTTNVIKKLIA